MQNARLKVLQDLYDYLTEHPGAYDPNFSTSDQVGLLMQVMTNAYGDDFVPIWREIVAASEYDLWELILSEPDDTKLHPLVYTMVREFDRRELWCLLKYATNLALFKGFISGMIIAEKQYLGLIAA